ncbi:hypothetical protein DFH08DRAFT_817782 [Mycena albidolilacea]|uniref:Uncharacterized protein n=1 Tax=Mycena albidolilacea TaxID=1033008 RepID=A0AAD6ZI14_9AGAR|nr:hypothetical protein DFH08DRAFT_817782 [Mycena albidolilacea]
MDRVGKKSRPKNLHQAGNGSGRRRRLGVRLKPDEPVANVRGALDSASSYLCHVANSNSKQLILLPETLPQSLKTFGYRLASALRPPSTTATRELAFERPVHLPQERALVSYVESGKHEPICSGKFYRTQRPWIPIDSPHDMVIVSQFPAASLLYICSVDFLLPLAPMASSLQLGYTVQRVGSMFLSPHTKPFKKSPTVQTTRIPRSLRATSYPQFCGPPSFTPQVLTVGDVIFLNGSIFSYTIVKAFDGIAQSATSVTSFPEPSHTSSLRRIAELLQMGCKFVSL